MESFFMKKCEIEADHNLVWACHAVTKTRFLFVSRQNSKTPDYIRNEWFFNVFGRRAQPLRPEHKKTDCSKDSCPLNKFWWAPQRWKVSCHFSIFRISMFSLCSLMVLRPPRKGEMEKTFLYRPVQQISVFGAPGFVASRKRCWAYFHFRY